MKTKPPILWRWKGHGKWTEGIVQQEMNDLIKISDEWYLKQDIDTRALWEMDAKRDEEGMAETELDFRAITEEKSGRRHPGDHRGRPSNEQMECFKRGGR
mgnify:CR=1 FL=1